MKPINLQIKDEEKKDNPDFSKIEQLLHDIAPEMIALQLDRIHHKKDIEGVLTQEQKSVLRDKMENERQKMKRQENPEGERSNP